MFSLHERTQRKVCRTAFVLVCAVPTLVTVCWAAYFHRPWQERDWQRSLESELHVQVTVEEVSAPRPHERSLQVLRLADLKLKKTLIEIDELHILGGTSFASETVTIPCGQIEQLAQALEIWLGSDSFQSTHWRVDHLMLNSNDGTTCELKNVRGETLVTATDSRHCHLQATHRGEKVQLLVDRNNDGKVHVTLNAQQASLPAWLLADVVPGASRWQKATFAGLLELECENSSVGIELRGEIQSIDTQAWVKSSGLQTTANLQFDKLRWRDGRFEAIQGSLSGTQGKISNALLTTLNTKLRCPLPTNSVSFASEGFQDFDQLGFRFQLNAEGLTVTGAFPSKDDQWAIALADGRPLVLQPAFSRLPLSFLVEAICAPADFTIPATRAAADLADKLPLPEVGTQKK